MSSSKVLVLTLLVILQSPGLRRCPGEEVANMKMFLILSNLVKSFKLRTPEGDKKVIGTQYEAGTGFIRNPKPYKVILEHRA